MRVREYMMAFLLMETLMVGTFSALDLGAVLSVLRRHTYPMFLIIGVWAGRGGLCLLQVLPLHAARLVLMLLAIMALYWNAAPPTSRSDACAVPRSLQTWAWWFFASFAVKMPSGGAYLLPDAHVEAPTAVGDSRSILLKMGGYGFLRFSLPMFPLASHDFAR